MATCRELPDIDPDDAPLVASLAKRGITATPAVWDDPAVDWSQFDLTVIRSTWDYSRRREDFLAWAARTPRLANPVAVLEWNTDKRYLEELARAGASTTPTEWLAPGTPWNSPAAGQWVIKPTVGAGSIDTGRYDMSKAAERELAHALIARLHGGGRHVMVQPYLSAVDEHGETALMFFGGLYSHAIRKGPMLSGPYQDVAGLFQQEDIRPREASAAELEVAEKALAAIPLPDPLLYARVDLIPGPDGQPVLLELELAEPSVFLRHDAAAGERFAAAVVAALR
ncbi:MAG: ATP-grasp domain-containing protein [Micromonosporaceae bacterium]